MLDKIKKETDDLKKYIERKQLKSCDDCVLTPTKDVRDMINNLKDPRCQFCVIYLRFLLENYNVYTDCSKKEKIGE